MKASYSIEDCNRYPYLVDPTHTAWRNQTGSDRSLQISLSDVFAVVVTYVLESIFFPEQWPKKLAWNKDHASEPHVALKFVEPSKSRATRARNRHKHCLVL